MIITEAAINKFRQITTGDMYPRIEIVAGGCNGFEKKFTLDTKRSDDICVDLGDVTVLIDTLTHDMLSNSTIDYKVGLDGEGFVVNIPESTSTCGCGISFSI